MSKIIRAKKVVAGKSCGKEGGSENTLSEKPEAGDARISISESVKADFLSGINKEICRLREELERLQDIESGMEIVPADMSEETFENLKGAMLEYISQSESCVIARRAVIEEYLNAAEKKFAMEKIHADFSVKNECKWISPSSDIREIESCAESNSGEARARFGADSVPSSSEFYMRSADDSSEIIVKPGSRVALFPETCDGNFRERISASPFSLTKICGGYHFALPQLPNLYDAEKTVAGRMQGRMILENMLRLIKEFKEKYGDEKPLSSFTAVFVFHYDRGKYFDTDNYNIKRPIDAVNSLLVENDDAVRSHIVLLTKECEENEVPFTDFFLLDGHEISSYIYAFLERSGPRKQPENPAV